MLHKILIISEVVVSIVMIISVLLQPSKSQGLTGFVPTTTGTFYSKNKSKTREAVLSKITIISAILFGVIILLYQLPIFK